MSSERWRIILRRWFGDAIGSSMLSCLREEMWRESLMKWLVGELVLKRYLYWLGLLKRAWYGFCKGSFQFLVPELALDSELGAGLYIIINLHY
jgi:hypothetical protein